MIIPSAVARKHENVRPYLAIVEKLVKDILRTFAENEGFAFIGRLKETESVAEKIETGRFASWDMLDDLYACCVIVPILKDEGRALEFLRQHFRCTEVKQRGSTQKDPSIFRFDATRFIGSVDERLMPNATQHIREVRFEVQIRTAFEHAWSAATHSLAYKGGQVDWRRLRLAAQLKAAVEQLDSLITGYDEIIDTIAPQVWPEVEAKRRIESFFRERFNTGSLPSELEPYSWLRFCDNLFAVVLASKRGFVNDKMNATAVALAQISNELDSLPFAQIPRSISLLQFCLGALAKQDGLTRPLERYVPLITAELRDFYPEVTRLGNGFVVD